MTVQKERLSETNTFQYQICLWCGHLQTTDHSVCLKCDAGKIGLGKPETAFAFLDLKLESRITIYQDGRGMAALMSIVKSKAIEMPSEMCPDCEYPRLRPDLPNQESKNVN